MRWPQSALPRPCFMPAVGLNDVVGQGDVCANPKGLAAHRTQPQGASELDDLCLESLIVDSFLFEHSADAQEAAAELIPLRLHA